VEQHGDPAGWPVVLMHGFPYDVHCYDLVAPPLVTAGAHVIVPYLRGYGPTRFIDATTPRSGQQAALANDLQDLIDALGVTAPIIAGFDWGGRAACLTAALWPQGVRALSLCRLQRAKHLRRYVAGAARVRTGDVAFMQTMLPGREILRLGPATRDELGAFVIDGRWAVAGL
jgi:pimeloyl-ACP methyl ester carboxylesterase